MFTSTGCSNDDNSTTAEEMGALILGKWAKTLTITSEGIEIEQSVDCPDTWNFLQSTVEIKDYAGNNEPPCGNLGLDVVREYEVVDNLLKTFNADGSISGTYGITQLTTTQMTLEIENSVFKWEKQ